MLTLVQRRCRKRFDRLKSSNDFQQGRSKTSRRWAVQRTTAKRSCDHKRPWWAPRLESQLAWRLSVSMLGKKAEKKGEWEIEFSGVNLQICHASFFSQLSQVKYSGKLNFNVWTKLFDPEILYIQFVWVRGEMRNNVGAKQSLPTQLAMSKSMDSESFGWPTNWGKITAEYLRSRNKKR